MSSTSRESTASRRRQIVEAALDLLAEVPLPALSTRLIARRLGLSQPALFRHFRSRDALLGAVIDHAREQVAEISAAAAGANQDEDQQKNEDDNEPAARFEALARGLLGFVEARPGLPRLLFAHSVTADRDLVRTALEQLVSMQRTLVSALVREGVAAGRLRPDVDPSDAATLLVGGLQGAILQWEMAGRPQGLEASGATLVALWLGGVGVHVPRAPAAVPVAAPSPVARGLVELDVRPVLAGGGDPLDEILATLDGMAPGDLLHLTSPFRPAPLLALLERQGHHIATRSTAPGVWSTTVGLGGAPAPLDLLDAEPPQPLEVVLEATARLEPGTPFAAWVPRYPRLLLPHLQARSSQVQWAIAEAADGAALVYLRRPEADAALAPDLQAPVDLEHPGGREHP